VALAAAQLQSACVREQGAHCASSFRWSCDPSAPQQFGYPITSSTCAASTTSHGMSESLRSELVSGHAAEGELAIVGSIICMPSKVLPFNDLVKLSFLTSTVFRDFGIRQEHAVEDWQSLVSTIDLLPQVPDSVRRTFSIAKNLFVLSLFVYEFGTVSIHYSGLVLESGIQNRWNLTMPMRVTLQCGSDILHDHSPLVPRYQSGMPQARLEESTCERKGVSKFNEKTDQGPRI